MSIPRTMFFIDGENLVFRYQAMLAAGSQPSPDVVHIPDVFVWHPGITRESIMNVARVFYYSSMVGDDLALDATRERIGTTRYEYNYGVAGEGGYADLVPVLFKKPAKTQKTRQVDIQIAIDMMRCAHDSGFELLCLLSGDGDYEPLIHEVMRRGKEVYVGAFSSGRAKSLQWCADEYVDLDPIFFPPPRPSGAPDPNARRIVQLDRKNSLKK